MFTGIVEEQGTVAEVVPTSGGCRLRVKAEVVCQEIELGASILHDGVCLTVVEVVDDGYWVEAVAETLQRSTLGRRAPGDAVNLERPMRLVDRLGGHLVQGHVDGVATLVAATPDGESVRLRFAAGPELLRYVVEKGSVAVDGVSLTVTEVDDGGFGVAVIPHTAAVTTLGLRAPGDPVNVEVDLVAKYVEKLVKA